MRLKDSKTFALYELTSKDGAYDFYSCHKCGRIFTREDELKAFKVASAEEDEVKVRICDCGSKRYSPAFPHGFLWLKPNVIKYTVKLLLARGLAPWADRNFPVLLPIIEKLVSIKEA